MTRSRDRSHFAPIYSANQDPWGYHTSPYEHAKYDLTLAMLGARRFTSGLEVGCSIGVLTRRLAMRCDRVLGIDFMAQPLATARRHCADLPSVRFATARVPDEWPSGPRDLIVLSEVLYFLTAVDIDRCVAKVARTLAPGGRVLLVNWLGMSGGDPTPGNAAARRFLAGSRGILRPLRHMRRADYRIDLLASGAAGSG